MIFARWHGIIVSVGFSKDIIVKFLDGNEDLFLNRDLTIYNLQFLSCEGSLLVLYICKDYCFFFEKLYDNEILITIKIEILIFVFCNFSFLLLL